jgi:hypothetical protein
VTRLDNVPVRSVCEHYPGLPAVLLAADNIKVERLRRADFRPPACYATRPLDP